MVEQRLAIWRGNAKSPNLGKKFYSMRQLPKNKEIGIKKKFIEVYGREGSETEILQFQHNFYQGGANFHSRIKTKSIKKRWNDDFWPTQFKS